MQIANPSAVWHFVRAALCVTGCVLVFGLSLRAGVHDGEISGKVLDMQGVAVAGARLLLVDSAGTLIRETESDQQGHFDFSGVAPGQYQLTAEISLFAPASVLVTVVAGDHADVKLQFQQIASLRQAITVTGSSAPSALTPDPSEHVVVHDQVLDANPGRPGAPVSLPGLPIETASGGIKAPQYFAPGVAGDHGEPIAQFYQIGDFL